MMKIRNVKPDAEFFSKSVAEILEKNSTKVEKMFCGLLCRIDIFGSDNFVFHANSSFLKNRHGSEINIGISVNDSDGILDVESDIADDSGRIISEGPSLRIRLTNWMSIESECDAWVKEFDDFLSDNFDIIVNEIKKLPDESDR
jgi:hypothetical protein